MNKLFDDRLRKMKKILDTYIEISNQQGVSEKLGISIKDLSKIMELNNRKYGTNREQYNPNKELINSLITSNQLEFLDKYDI